MVKSKHKKPSPKADSPPKFDMTFDHKVLEGAQATRRYFAKFERIIAHLSEVADLSDKDGLLRPKEASILKSYLEGLSNSFAALSYKYLMAGRVGEGSNLQLSIDKSDSGFPVFQELLEMAADALQAPAQLESLASPKQLKREMVNHMLTQHEAPKQLQYALAQRLYYECLMRDNLFLSQNLPKGVWTGSSRTSVRRSYMLHWATYDSQSNLPAIYMLDLEDTGRTALPKDSRRWPRVKAHLMAQSVSSLNLLTIARGIDQDFDDLHPKTLRRFHLGPMYSHAYTEQHGPLRDVLAEASGEPGLDWAVTWMLETLESEKKTVEKTGLFKTSQREIYKIDTLDPAAIEIGATDVVRALILPHRAYQVLKERNPPSLSRTRKYVVGENANIISYK